MSPLRSMRLIPMTLLMVMAVVASSTISCSSGRGGKPGTEDLDSKKIPTMVTRDVETFISDSGITRYHITTKLWNVYDEVEEPYWSFPKGLFLEKYDNNLHRDATVEADSATYFSQKRLWRLDGNVRMVNTAGDRFLTNQLFWDQVKREVYSDSFIHVEKSDRTIEGYGFESNDQMTAYTVRNPSGIFPAKRTPGDEAADNTAADSAKATVVPPTTITPSSTAQSLGAKPVTQTRSPNTPRTPDRPQNVNGAKTADVPPTQMKVKPADLRAK